MAFDRKLLNDNEEIVLDLRPHWIFMTPPTLGLVAAVAFGIASLVLGYSWMRWVALGAIVLGVFWFVKRYWTWVTTNFVVTTDRVIYSWGIFAKKGQQIPLDKVTNIGFDQNFWERIIGAGDLTIESAGLEGTTIFYDIRKPNMVKNEIFRQAEQSGDRRYDKLGDRITEAIEAQVQSSPGAAPAGPSIAQQIRELDELRQQGLISPEEFEAKRTQLLERM